MPWLLGPRVHICNFPLVKFCSRVLHFSWVVNGIGFEELALMEGASDSLRGRLWLGLGDGDRVMGMWSMRLCHLFKTFWLTCPLVDFNHSKTTSHCNVTCFECSSLEIFVFNSFKVSYSQSFNVSLAYWGFGYVLK